jgi:hypothetical protein
LISAQELLSSTYHTISIHKRGLNILLNWPYNRVVRVIDISSKTLCVNLQWQRADKIIVASSGASKVPGSRRVKATTTSREPKLLRPTLETSLATVPWPLALTLPTSLPT